MRVVTTTPSGSTAVSAIPEAAPAALRPVVCVIEEAHRDPAVAAAVYDGLDLAHAFATTGATDLLDTWADLVGSFCDQVPVGHDPSDVSARRLQNWIYAWQRFGAAPGFRGLPEGFAARLRARIEADAEHLRTHLTAEGNHRTLELYALLLVGIALDDPTGARSALDELAAIATTDIGDDGVHRECSTDHHLIVLRSFVGAVANARAADLPVPPALLDRTHRACDFALHVQRPDGVTPAISDGDQGDCRALLALAGTVLDRPDLTWAATAGTRGRAPGRRHVSFPVGGYHVQRSGWGTARPYADERWCLLDAGPVGDGGHGHYDRLSVELYGGGRPLVVDPGRYTDADDGSGPRGPAGWARLIARRTVPGLDVLVAQAGSPCHDAVHTRTVVLVDDTYWLVHDRLRGSAPHRYRARWQLAPEADGRTGLERGDDQVTVHAPGVALVVPRGTAAVAVEDGWVAPRYGVRHRAPAVTVTAVGRAHADLFTAVLPTGPGDGPVDVRVAMACRGDAVRAWVQRPGVGVDRVRWTTDAGDAQWRREPC